MKNRLRLHCCLGACLCLASPAARAGELLVFISFSMPETSLRLLAREAERAGATLVLRGLPGNSMPDLAERLRQLLEPDSAQPSGTRTQAVAIDPTWFQRFAVQAVPAFVLTRQTPAPCRRAHACETPEYLRLAGDLSLLRALQYFQQHPGGGATAEPFLARLEAPP